MNIREILGSYVDEMYSLARGEFILDPEKTIYWHDGRITRRHAKHMIEQRKEERKSPKEIKELLMLSLEAIVNPDFEVPNTNERHPGSIMRVKIFEQGGDGVVVVMDKEVENYRDVITVFSRDPKGIRALKKKKPQESASGETPRP